MPKKTHAAKRIITIDGCALSCALKIVEGAEFRPDVKISLVGDCGIQKGKPFTHSEVELELAISAIQAALR